MNNLNGKLHAAGTQAPSYPREPNPKNRNLLRSTDPQFTFDVNLNGAGIFRADQLTGKIVLTQNTPSHINIARGLLTDKPSDDPNDPLNKALAQAEKNRHSVDFGENGWRFITPENINEFSRRAFYGIHQGIDTLVMRGVIESTLPHRVAELTYGLFTYNLDRDEIFLRDTDPDSLEQAKNLLTDTPNNDPNDPINKALARAQAEPKLDFGKNSLNLITEENFNDIYRRAKERVFYQDSIDGDNSDLK